LSIKTIPSYANTVPRKFIPAQPVRFVNRLQHATRWLPSRHAEPRTVNSLTSPSRGGRKGAGESRHSDAASF
jgi:hypothetical protein